MAVLEHAQLPQEVVIQMNTGWILDSFGTFVTPPAWMQYMLDCDMDKSTAEIGSYHLQGKRNLPGVKGAIYLKAHAYSLYFQMCESTNMASIWMWRSTWIWIWNGTESLLDTRCAYVASDTAWTTIVRFFFCRNLPHVQYELYDACLARDPVTAMNKMGAPLGQKPTRGWKYQRCWERCVTHAAAKKHQQAVFVFCPSAFHSFFFFKATQVPLASDHAWSPRLSLPAALLVTTTGRSWCTRCTAEWDAAAEISLTSLA